MTEYWIGPNFLSISQERKVEMSILGVETTTSILGNKRRKMEISLEWSDVYRGKLNEAKVNLKRFQHSGNADDAIWRTLHFLYS